MPWPGAWISGKEEKVVDLEKIFSDRKERRTEEKQEKGGPENIDGKLP